MMWFRRTVMIPVRIPSREGRKASAFRGGSSGSGQPTPAPLRRSPTEGNPTFNAPPFSHKPLWRFQKSAADLPDLEAFEILSLAYRTSIRGQSNQQKIEHPPKQFR